MDAFVGAVAIEVGKCSAEPIKRQFNYLCCFNSNIQNLEAEATKLNDTMAVVERQVEAARWKAEDIQPQVTTWQQKVSRIQAERSEIEPEILNVKSCCLAMKARFSLSRKAKKMVAAMKELQDDWDKLGPISVPALPAAMALIPLKQTYELESRKQFEENIMADLREKKVKMMGISGMGGVGKTTMAKNIMRRARKEGLFAEILMVVVSQPVNMSRIQKDMADLLGLELKVDNISARAHLLRTRLMNSKSVLIILDDLWKEVNLEDLGISDQRELKECVILLTSRNTDVFSAMNVKKSFQMKILEAKEAWSLFKEKVGTCADDQTLFSTAQEIVRECNGLPIALVTVGSALKHKKNAAIWKNALRELKSGYPEGISDYLADVYNPLKLSYDLLEDEQAKSIFLLCCLFPEDYNISLSFLSLYAWGLGTFERITSLRDARNKVQATIETLKSRSLLLDGRNEAFTKMHDVVRDVGIFIAGRKKLIDHNLDCTWISIFGQRVEEKTTLTKIMLPGGSDFLNLRFLLISKSTEPGKAREELPLSDNFFKRAIKLNVLSIKGYILRYLPNTIQLLQNLQTLILISCESLEDISIVGELVCLEILYCRDCDNIKELPEKMGRLSQLKLLHIENCSNLTIGAGLISRLIGLEELMLIQSFSAWESRASNRKNACLCELNSLTSLTKLRIHIQDVSLAAEHIRLPNLVEFDISIGSRYMNATSYVNHIRLEFEREATFGRLGRLEICGYDGNERLVSFARLGFLSLSNCGKIKSLFSLSIASNLVHLRKLLIESCGEMVKVMEDKVDEVERRPFIKLKVLKLVNLPKLKAFCDSQCAPELPSLREVFISNCPLMERLPFGSIISPISSYSFENLESIEIMACSMLEEVVLWNEEENGQDINGRRITFPKLKKLNLHVLPRLTSFCKGIQSIEFPLLTEMEIMKCPNLESLEATFGGLEHLVIDEYGNIKSLFSPSTVGNLVRGLTIDFFAQLVELEVCNCGNIISLFSSSIAGNLVNLRELGIVSCREMVKVIEDGEVEMSPFIKLEVLTLIDLPKLKAFWRRALHLPSLRKVLISECPRMERFSIRSIISPMSSNSFKNLEIIVIIGCSMLEQVVLWNEEENGKEDINGQSSHVTFPKLKELFLYGLPRLTSFCKGIQRIEFPLLTRMEIMKCPNLKSLISSKENDKRCSGAINYDADDSLLHLFCKSQAAFGRPELLVMEGYENICSKRSVSLCCDQIPVDFFMGLSILRVKYCGNIKSLFSTLIAKNLVNLRDLTIHGCREMVKVIEDEEVEMSPLIKLEWLSLEKLHNLKAFCDWRCPLHLPSLKHVFIKECPEMERFSFGSLTTPNLNYIWKNSERISEYTQDLNDALFGGDFLHLDILFGSDDDQ